MQNPGIEFWGLLFLEGYNIEIGTMSIVENRERKWESGMLKSKCGSGKFQIAGCGFIRRKKDIGVEMGRGEGEPGGIKFGYRHATALRIDPVRHRFLIYKLRTDLPSWSE